MPRLTHRPRLALLLTASLAAPLATSTVARADHGCSDERVSLPDGPGSIAGVGDNVEINPNMGSMSTSLPIEVPPGFASATPALSLEYSSSAGSGEVGYGWSFPLPSIERMRMRGLPVYDETDEIVADGSSELVRTGTLGASAVYRARFEGSFVRYRWHDSDGGVAGYWTAERPDGTVAYYGADETGAAVRSARVQTPAGEVYRWHLVAEIDRFGHAIRYGYAKDGEHSLIDEITYAHGADGAPRYAIRFAYEPRPDPLTTGEPGFLLALTKRLSEVRVLAGPEAIRRYLLAYEDLATSGGASRLAAVETRGRGDAVYPIVLRYAYSRSLDGTCPGACEQPFVVDMGTLPGGVENIRSGRATLLDMNGDALPDIVSTSPTGLHTIIPAQIDPATGVPSFGAPYASAATTGSTSFVLSAPGVQVLDVDGDGFTDMIDAVTGSVLCNTGSGDWGGSGCLMNSSIPDLYEDGSGDANPRFVRFLDYDDDRRIDMIRTLAAETQVYVNTGSAFVPRTVEHIGAQFDDSPTLQLADLNGDGLQDPVEILPGATQLRYRLNLGYGRWTEWTTAPIDGFGTDDPLLFQLEDINGDGAADVVLVAGNEVRYSVNRGDHFDPAITLTSAGVSGELPERGADTVVLFADMNGSGSRDIVWVEGARVRFLELFPTRPNLISRVENGIGSVQQIAYGSSVLQQARDAGTADEWEDRLPYPVNVVIEIDVWNTLTGGEDGAGLHDRTQMVYHDGFYDGVERTFRGFAYVEQLEGDDVAEDGEEGSLAVFRYDVGKDDPYRAGRLLHAARLGGAPGAWRPIQETFYTYEDCPLAEIPASGLSRPVRFVCETAREVVVQEGAPEAEWVTTRAESERDGYGQVIREARLGVIHMGPPSAPGACGACDAGGPCGAACAGDEQIVETEYIDPGAATSGEWILGRVMRSVAHDGAGGPRAETVTRYDGPDFVGLPEGRLERGEPTSVRTRIASGEGDDAWIWTARVRRDAHGNVVEILSPRGAIDLSDDQRSRFTYDGDGLRMVREEDLFRDGEGRASILRRDTAYDPAFGDPVMQTAPILVRGGAALTAPNARRIRYDAFGRPDAIFEAGDPDGAPSRELAYELAEPVSRIVLRSRSTLGGPLDAEEIQCLDGRGRPVATRNRLGEGDYQVSGFTELNARGKPVREYQGYRSESGECDTAAPSAPFTSYTYDALDRTLTVSVPDDDVHGTRSVSRYEYAPLVVRAFDAEDADETSAHASTPLGRRFDGLGRTLQVTRDLGEGRLGVTRLAYDGLGRLASVIDPLGEVREQTYDLAGRVLSATDPSHGTSTFTLDEAGNVVERRDARGARIAAEYDALGRRLAHWDPQDEAGTRTAFVYDLDESCEECEHGAGRMVSVTYPLGALGAGRDEVGYDARGRTVFQARTIEGHRFVTRHEQDLVGRPLRTTLPGGVVLERGFDGVSRPTSIDGVIDAITYDGRGNVAGLLYANGVRTDRTYDGVQRLMSLETSVGGVVLQGTAFERDRVGNVLRARDVSDLSRQGPSLDASYEYDAWYRLARAAFGPEGSSEVETLEMDYDVGDRVLRRESSLGAASRAHVGAYEYDPVSVHRVVRAGERTYDYDAAGQVTERGATALEWDYFGRLVSARAEARADGAFFYGADRARVAKQEEGGTTYYLGPELEVEDGIVNVYPRLGLWRVARIRSSSLQTQLLSDVAPLGASDGEINAADAWIAHASEAGIVEGAGAASDAIGLLRGAARRLLALDGGERAYLHHDVLGSVTLATDDAGEVTGEALYYPNGEARYRRGFTDRHGFTGQEEDASTGLLAFSQRYLDPEAGRWASPDPAFAVLDGDAFGEHLSDAMSVYGYVGNRTMSAIDPDGLASKSLVARINSGVRGWVNRNGMVRNPTGFFEWARTHKGQVAKAIGGTVIAAATAAMLAPAAPVLVAGAVFAALAFHSVALGAKYMLRKGPAGGGTLAAARRGKFPSLISGSRAWLRSANARGVDRFRPQNFSLARLVGRVGGGGLVASAGIVALGALAVGLTVATGGTAAIAGAAAYGAWNAAELITGAIVIDMGAAAADAIGSPLYETANELDRLARQPANAARVQPGTQGWNW